MGLPDLTQTSACGVFRWLMCDILFSSLNLTYIPSIINCLNQSLVFIRAQPLKNVHMYYGKKKERMIREQGWPAHKRHYIGQTFLFWNGSGSLHLGLKKFLQNTVKVKG